MVFRHRNPAHLAMPVRTLAYGSPGLVFVRPFGRRNVYGKNCFARPLGTSRIAASDAVVVLARTRLAYRERPFAFFLKAPTSLLSLSHGLRGSSVFLSYQNLNVFFLQWSESNLAGIKDGLKTGQQIFLDLAFSEFLEPYVASYAFLNVLREHGGRRDMG